MNMWIEFLCWQIEKDLMTRNVFSFSIDVQGNSAAVGSVLGIWPSTVRIKMVLVNIRDGVIEKDYSRQLRDIFEPAILRFTSTLTLVKLKYDVLFIGVDNNIAVLARDSGIVKWDWT